MRLSVVDLCVCVCVHFPFIVPEKEKPQTISFCVCVEPEVSFHKALSPFTQYKHTLALQSNQAVTYCCCHTKHSPKHQEIIQQKRHLK